jgi:malate:Na+ symporter
MDAARDDTEDEKGAPIDVGTVAAAGLAAITLYLMGVMCHRLFGLPAPVAMLFLAVLAKLTSAVSPHLQQGGFVVYKFFSSAVTYPLLFAIGVSMTPWDKLMAAFNLPNLITIVSMVATLMATGALVGRCLNMYPIEPVTAGRAEPATSPFSRPPIACNSCPSPRSRPASEARSQ